jgi:hypothetical protein
VISARPRFRIPADLVHERTLADRDEDILIAERNDRDEESLHGVTRLGPVASTSGQLQEQYNDANSKPRQNLKLKKWRDG